MNNDIKMSAEEFEAKEAKRSEQFLQLTLGKLNDLIEASIQYEGFKEAYIRQRRLEIRQQLWEKLSGSEWLKITMPGRPDLDGYYEIGELTIRPANNYYHSSMQDTKKDLILWVYLTKLQTTADGYRRSYVDKTGFNPDVLNGQCAVPCDKPPFKERKPKKPKTLEN